MLFRQVFLFSVLLAVLPAAHSVDRLLIPIDSFVRKADFSIPRLSPDGKYLAITVNVPGRDRVVPTIVVYGLPDLKQVSASQLGYNEFPLSYTWVSNTRLVVAKGIESGLLEAPQSPGELLGMDYDGSHQEYLYGYNMERKSRHGDRFTDNLGFGFVTGTPRVRNGRFYMAVRTFNDERMLYDANGLNGERKLLASLKNPHVDFIQQRDGTPRFAVGTNPVKHEHILYRRDDNTDTWSLISGEATTERLRPLFFSADDTEFLAQVSLNNGPVELVRQNLATGVRVPLMKDSTGDIDKFIMGASEDLPIAAGSAIGVPQVRYLDEESADAKLHKMLSAKFPGNFVDFINYTDDGSRLLFWVGSDREPGVYFLFDRASGKAYPLFSAREQIDPAQMAERRPVSFKARDGLELHGYITLPQRTDGKLPPLVLMPHDGPHDSSDKWFFDEDAQFMASRGYAVLQLNFRGSSGRGAAFQQLGARQWGAKIQDDLVDGVKYAIAQHLVDPDRVCAVGGGFGGYAALMVTVRAPELFKCAVGYAGAYDLNLYFKERGVEAVQASNTVVLNEFIVDFLGTDKDELRLFSPAFQADKIKVPVLLVHGKEDPITPFEHAKTMRDALEKVGNPPEWMAVENEGHGFYATKNITAYYEKLEAFLGKHLK